MWGATYRCQSDHASSAVSLTVRPSLGMLYLTTAKMLGLARPKRWARVVPAAAEARTMTMEGAKRSLVAVDLG